MTRLLEPLPEAFEFESNLALSEESKTIVNWYADIVASYYSPASRQQENLAQRFYRLLSIWQTETQLATSVIQRSTHYAYQQIIGMGPSVLPLILRELEKNGDYWYWALKAITTADPVSIQSRGKIAEMKKAWLEWAQNQGYKW